MPLSFVPRFVRAMSAALLALLASQPLAAQTSPPVIPPAAATVGLPVESSIVPFANFYVAAGQIGRAHV